MGKPANGGALCKEGNSSEIENTLVKGQRLLMQVTFVQIVQLGIKKDKGRAIHNPTFVCVVLFSA